MSLQLRSNGTCTVPWRKCVFTGTVVENWTVLHSTCFYLCEIILFPVMSQEMIIKHRFALSRGVVMRRRFEPFPAAGRTKIKSFTVGKCFLRLLKCVVCFCCGRVCQCWILAGSKAACISLSFSFVNDCSSNETGECCLIICSEKMYLNKWPAKLGFKMWHYGKAAEVMHDRWTRQGRTHSTLLSNCCFCTWVLVLLSRRWIFLTLCLVCFDWDSAEPSLLTFRSEPLATCNRWLFWSWTIL